jgi:gluconolactonase
LGRGAGRRLEPDLAISSSRSAHERVGGHPLETILSAHRDTIINTGAWTNISIEHTARTGADKGYVIITPEDCDDERRVAQPDVYAMHVAEVTKADAVIAALKGK